MKCNCGGCSPDYRCCSKCKSDFVPCDLRASNLTKENDSKVSDEKLKHGARLQKAEEERDTLERQANRLHQATVKAEAERDKWKEDAEKMRKALLEISSATVMFKGESDYGIYQFAKKTLASLHFPPSNE